MEERANKMNFIFSNILLAMLAFMAQAQVTVVYVGPGNNDNNCNDLTSTPLTARKTNPNGVCELLMQWVRTI
jgi:hypothetical protein